MYLQTVSYRASPGWPIKPYFMLATKCWSYMYLETSQNSLKSNTRHSMTIFNSYTILAKYLLIKLFVDGYLNWKKTESLIDENLCAYGTLCATTHSPPASLSPTAWTDALTTHDTCGSLYQMHKHPHPHSPLSSTCTHTHSPPLCPEVKLLLELLVIQPLLDIHQWTTLTRGARVQDSTTGVMSCWQCGQREQLQT